MRATADGPAVYRRLYAALSGQLLDLGHARHQVDVLTGDPETVATWLALGFGVQGVKGMLPVGAVAAHRDPGARVRPAVADDREQIIELCLELAAYHQRPPMFIRSAGDAGEDAACGVDLSLSNPEACVMVAEDDGGMMEAEPDHLHDRTATVYIASTTERWRRRGVGGAILVRVDAWARARGYANIAVGWSSANLVSDRFYRAHGFRPIRYELVRGFTDLPA